MNRPLSAPPEGVLFVSVGEDLTADTFTHNPYAINE